MEATYDQRVERALHRMKRLDHGAIKLCAQAIGLSRPNVSAVLHGHYPYGPGEDYLARIEKWMRQQSRA